MKVTKYRLLEATIVFTTVRSTSHKYSFHNSALEAVALKERNLKKTPCYESPLSALTAAQQQGEADNSFTQLNELREAIAESLAARKIAERELRQKQMLGNSVCK